MRLEVGPTNSADILALVYLVASVGAKVNLEKENYN